MSAVDQSNTSHTETADGGGAPSDPNAEPPVADGLERSRVNRDGLALVWKMAKTEPRRFSLALIGGVAWGAMVVGSTTVLGRVQDDVITPVFAGQKDRAVLWWGVAALVAVGVLRGLSVGMRRWFGSITEARVQAQMRRSLIDRILTMPLAEHRRRSPGQLMAIADNDVGFSTMALMPVPLVVGLVALIAASLSSLIASDWTFAAIGCVLFPLLFAVSRYFSAQMVEPAHLTQAQVGEVSRVAHESFDGSMIVKVLGREAAESQRFEAKSAALRDSRLLLARVNARYHPLVDALPYLGMVALMIVGAIRMKAGAVTQGDVVAAVVLFGWLNFPVRVTGFLFESLPRAVVSSARVAEVMRGESFVDVVDPPKVLPNGALGVEIDAVDFEYEPGVAVLSGVSATVNPGEVVAVVGPTGSGKSSLCELIVRLETVSKGQIRIGGVPIEHVGYETLVASVCLVFQESFLFADTLRQNLVLGIDASDEMIRRALTDSQAVGFVDQLPNGLDTVMGERGVTLSGGQRQRIALARALLRQPRVLVLDDATSAVDARIEAKILRGVSETHQGITMMVVAHRMSTIRLADRIVFLDNGKLVAEGTHDDLMVHAGYRALVTAYEADEADELSDDSGPDGEAIEGTAPAELNSGDNDDSDDGRLNGRST